MFKVSQLKLSELSKISGASVPQLSKHFKSKDNSGVTRVNNRITGISPEAAEAFLKKSKIFCFDKPAVILSANLCGGVGKTTSIYNLGACCRRVTGKDNPIVYIDGDSQGSFTSMIFGSPADDEEPILIDVLEGKAKIDDVLTEIGDNVWLIKSNLNQAWIDKILSKPQDIKKKMLGVYNKIFDKLGNKTKIFQDHTPQLSTLFASSVCALYQLPQDILRAVIIPIRSDSFALQGGDYILEEIEDLKDTFNLTGEIDEYYESTQFVFGSTIVVNSSANALPTAITFDDTFPPTDPMTAVCSTDQTTAKYECMEGMLIDMPQGFISSAYAAYFGANIGDLVVKAGAQRALREPGIEFPGGGGSIQTFDGNPELFEVDIDELLLSPAYYAAGSEIAIEGVIGYNFGEYEVWPKSLTVLTENVLPGVVRDAQAQEVTVASFNLFRLFDDVDNKGEEDDDAVATTQEFEEKVAKLSDYVVNTLKAPMIVAVQEVENLNSLTALADKINTDSGLNYQAELIEGNDKGGIDVGVLYQSNVSLAAVNQLGKDTTIVNPDMSVTLLHDRPPLHVQADVTVGFDEFRVNLLIVHLRSRGSIDDAQEGDRVRLKRMTQANDVAAMVADIETNNTGEPVIVIGDFNAFQFSDGYVDVMGQIDGTAVESMNTLWTEPLFVAEPMTQAVQYMTPFEQYSYVYQGNAQVLDNAVMNDEALLPFVDIEFGRGNADANIDFGTDTQTVLRASDHDGLVLYFTIELDVIFRNGFED